MMSDISAETLGRPEFCKYDAYVAQLRSFMLDGHSKMVSVFRRRKLVLLSLALCILSLGCQDVGTIWSAEAPSPDGNWIAIATTRQHGGPGTAGVETRVELKRTKGSTGQLVLGFFHNPNNTNPRIDLTMRWVSPSHLEVGWGGDASLTFQVVKYQGIEISVRDLSGGHSN